MRPSATFPEGTAVVALVWMKKRLKHGDYLRFQAVCLAAGEAMMNAKIGQLVGRSHFGCYRSRRKHLVGQLALAWQI